MIPYAGALRCTGYRFTFNSFPLMKFIVKRKLVNCKRRATDVRVEPNMSVSPSQMMRLSEQGVAVSAQTNAAFNDGVVNPSWDVPLDRMRGVDPAEMWTNMMDIREKAKKGHKRDVELYGNVSPQTK